MEEDNGLRSLVRCEGGIFGPKHFAGYRIFQSRYCDPEDPNVVAHNCTLEQVRMYRSLIEDPC